jgi:hypothetical protein
MLALYHQFNLPSLPMHIVSEHGDGTVSLSQTKDGAVFVRCPLGRRYGQATPLLVKEAAKPIKEVKPVKERKEPSPEAPGS